MAERFRSVSQTWAWTEEDPRLYQVTFTDIAGSRVEFRAYSDYGPFKAVAMAAAVNAVQPKPHGVFRADVEELPAPRQLDETAIIDRYEF